MTDKQLIAKIRQDRRLYDLYDELCRIFDRTGRLHKAQRLTLERELKRD